MSLRISLLWLVASIGCTEPTPSHRAPLATPTAPQADQEPERSVGAAPGFRTPAAGQVRGNVLLVVIDDLGADKLGAYGIHPEVPATPVIDGLAADGVIFTHAYASPMCSPSRAQLQTGRQAYRTGIGEALSFDGAWLTDEEVTMPEMLAMGDAGYANSLVGKWHLASTESNYYDHPNDSGWDHFSGLVHGINEWAAFDGLPQDYWSWEKTIDGVPERAEVYHTTDVADDAIARIQAMPEPWVLMVSFFAPHEPFHLPPAALTPSPTETGTTEQARLYNRMVEGVDTELGRILDALDATAARQTTVMLMGDNGTPASALEPDLPHGKGSIYEGGVRIPMIVSGPVVADPNRASPAMVQMTDVFATVGALAGVDVDDLGIDLDSHSFLDVLSDPAAPGSRTAAISENFSCEAPIKRHVGVGCDADFAPEDVHRYKLGVRDDTYRLARFGSRDELYLINDDHVEGLDLLRGHPGPTVMARYDALVDALPDYWLD